MQCAPRSPATFAAGELADVVAHELSAIAIQAEAAESVLRKDPTLAAVPLAIIRGSALEALADVRLLLSALSDGADVCGRAPLPGLDELPALVARARAAGQPVTLEVSGAPRVLPASYQLAAYRVVQEGLAGAREHAPGAPTTVRVAWAADAVEITVEDPGGDGRDLRSLEARMALHGGDLEAGLVPEGHRVRAVFRP